MGQIDSGSKSNRLLASRRYTHNTFTAAQEAFTNVLDLRSEEIYTQAQHITGSSLPFSGSSQNASTVTINDNNITKYWYRHKLTKSNVNNEVWLFLNPTGSDSGVGSQLINDGQQTNFISPKYSVSSLANSTTEDSTPGYLAVVLKSTSLNSGSLDSGDIVSTNDYQFDYKTGVLQFLNSSVDPTDSQYVYMTVYQYVGKTLKTGLEVEGNISGSAISTGSFGQLNATEFSSDTATLISGSTNPAAVSGSWQGVVGSGSLGMISGSSLSTGSFGRVIIGEMGNSDLTVVSSSISTRATTLENANISGGFVAQTVLSGSGTLISGSSLSTGSFASLRVTSPQTLTIDNKGTVSGSATSTGSFGAVNVAGMSVSNVKEVSSSIASRATTLEGSGTIQGVGTTNNVTFGNVTATGIVTAEEFHTEFVSASISFVSGSNKFGDDTSDIQSMTGSLRVSGSDFSITSVGTISGSATSTGSFGAVDVAGMTNSNLVDVSSSVSTRTTTLENANISGGFVAQTVLSGSGTLISGSVLSTGSFGRVIISEMGNSDLTVVSSSVSTRTTTLENANISGGFVAQTVLSGSGTIFSGSVLSTGSFGSLRVTSPQTLTIDNTGTVSGSATSTGSFGSISVATSASLDSLVTSKADINGGTIDGTTIGAASHTTIKGTTIDATTDFTIDGLVITADTITNDATLTIDGADDMVIDVDGGNLDVKDDGVALLNISATKVSGSATSTGSFGKVIVAEMGNSDLTNVSSSVSTRTTTLENANISGGFVAQTVLSGSGTIFSGSVLSTGSFGSLRVTSPQTLTIDNTGTVSGSATSTGSFGYLHIGGNITASGVIKADAFESVTGGTTIDFGDSLNITGDITASGDVSGSSTSTGSFGAIDVTGMTVSNLVDVSSSFSTRVTTEEGNVDDLQTDSGSFSTRVGLLEGSGSITESSASFSTRITTEEGNVDDLQTDSGSFSTRVALLEGSGSITESSASFSTRVTDLNLSLSGSTTLISGSSLSTGSFGYLHIGGNITASGTVKADAFESVTGGTTIDFGDSLDITGDITASGHISGSSTSTGSFGAIDATGMSVSNLVDVSSSFSTRVTTEEGNVDDLQTDSGSFSTRVALLEGSGSITESSASFSTRATTLENANISGGFVAQTVLSGSGTLISGSALSTGSFASLRVTSPQTLTIDNTGTVSGSATSTGSFGAISATDLTAISTTISGSFTDISASFALASSSYSTASGSLSTRVSGLKDDSGSFSTRVSNLKTDSGSFSTRVTDLNLSLSGSTTLISGSSLSTGSFGRLETTQANADIGGNVVTLGGALTTAGNLITQNNNVTINAEGAARTLTLNESLTVGDGNDGTLTFGAASKTLTVEDNATVNQDLTTDANVTFNDITSTGTVTAQEFHTEFVSASIVFSSGSTKFGDTADDIHQFTGSIETSGSIFLTNISGSHVSASVKSTGSFGAVNVGGMSVQNLVDVSSSISTRLTTEEGNVDDLETNSGSFSTRVTLLEGSGSITESSASFSTRVALLEGSGSITESSASFSTRITDLKTDSGSFSTRVTDLKTDSGSLSTRVTDLNLSLSGSTTLISGSVFSTGSFGSLRVTSPQTLTIDNKGTVSGSSISTGSFGRLEGNGAGLSNITAVPFLATSSYYSADADVKITGSLSVSGAISGSYSGLSVGQKYKHIQSAAATTWTISHNFDYQYVNIDVYDSDDRIVIPTTVTATDSNTITITFGELVSGTAIVSTGGQAIDEKGKNVTHTQADASSNWRVTHSIGDQYPVVTVYDGDDNVIIPETINAADGSKMDIVFAQPQTGFAKISVGGGVPFGAITSSAQLSKDSFGDITGSVSSTGSFGALRVTGPTLTVDNVGTVSGSTTSTGSFGAVNIAGMTVSNLIDFSSSIASRVTDEESDFTAAGISGSWQGVVGSGSLGMVSGSAISTGSFGAVSVAGMTVPNLLDFSSSLASRITSEEGDFTAAGISGSWQGVVGSGSLGMVSGSAISTGSFGNVNVSEMTVPSVSALSSSVASRLDTLSADVIALSIALG